MKPRPGIVLLLALLCIVILELTAAALHFAAVQQMRAARAGTRALQLRLGAQATLAAAVTAFPIGEALAAPVGGTFLVPGASLKESRYGIQSSASAERLADSLFLLRGEARSPLQEIARAGLLVLVADPSRTIVSAAVRTGANLMLGSGASLLASDIACALSGPAAAVELGSATALSVAPGGSLEGAVTITPGLEGGRLAALLPFDLDQVLKGAAAISPETLTPGPVAVGSSCATAVSSNWGDPRAASPTAPCARWYPVLSRTGNLTLAGGSGQGVLYVSGDLVVSGEAVFSGLVMVSGRATVLDGATISGMIVAAGDITISTAAVRGSRCAVRDALAGVPALAGPFARPGRRWIPLF